MRTAWDIFVPLLLAFVVVATVATLPLLLKPPAVASARGTTPPVADTVRR